jgi:transcription initiation factor IIE alpha subunit
MTVFRVKVCGCGHDMGSHPNSGACEVCAQNALGLEPCPKFHSRRHGASAPAPKAARVTYPLELTTALANLQRACGDVIAALHTKGVTQEQLRPVLLNGAPKKKWSETVFEDRNDSLGKGHLKVLKAVAQYPKGVTQSQIAVLTGYKKTSRRTYLQALRTDGFIESNDGLILATEAGRERLGPFEQLPVGRKLVQYWLDHLSEGERRLFEIIVRAAPSDVENAELIALTGYQKTSVRTYLQKLKARELVTNGHGGVKASEALFQ